MRLGVQFSGTVAANGTGRWFTHSWNAASQVIWLVVPTGPVQDRAAQIEWKVQVERQTATLVKYFIEVRNLTNQPVNVEARYAILN